MDISQISGPMNVDFAKGTNNMFKNKNGPLPKLKQLDNQSHNYVWIVENALTERECDKLVAITEKQQYGSAPLTVGANTFVMDEDVRNNERVIWDDVVSAKELWNRVKSFVPEQCSQLHKLSSKTDFQACGLNERFRFYKYTAGQYFKPHYDGCFPRKPQYDTETNTTIIEQSFLTLIFYLNDVHEGGETIFHDESWHGEHGTPRCSVKPKKGSALFFVHSQLHEGAEIPQHSNEVKYVMRTDVMFRKTVPGKKYFH